ncbi:MAG: hypothetical protein CL797_08370 [Chromatiales bacterium]|jgi:tetratricopeptide (TPR) repeat protein|nr:hypothetical protein [Chromatiales bacterium]
MRLIISLALSCIVFSLSGCGSPEQRAAEYLATAQELFADGDYLGAKLEAQNAAQIEPKNAGTSYLLALIAEQEGNGRALVKHLEVTVAEAPEMVEARVKLGMLYAFARLNDQAIEQLTVAQKLAPDDPGVLLLSARLWLQQGDSDRGLAELDKLLGIDPAHVEAIGMKVAALQANDPDRALGLLDEAIRRLPGDEARPLRELQLDVLARHERTQGLEQALLAMIGAAEADDSKHQARLARFYRDQGELDKAEDMLRDIAAAASGDAGARLDVVRFLAEARTPEAATEALQAFIDADPENQQLKIVLGDRYLENDQSDAAVTIYAAAAALDPLSALGLLARTKLAAERVRSGDPNGAEEQVMSILADDPAYPHALLMRAGLFFTQQRYDDAIADLRILLRKEANNQRALLLLARSEIAAGNVILGKDAYRRLLELNPGHVAAVRELVTVMLRADDFDEAEALLVRLTEDGSGSMEVGVLMIELHVIRENWQAAEAEARRYVAGADPNGTGTWMLGQVLESQQRYAEAAEAFSRALEKSPESVSILQGLARVLNAQGKKDETITLLRRSAAKYPERPGILLVFGGALMDRGQSSEALQVFEQVIEDHPKLVSGYVAVASLYLDDTMKRIAAYRRGLTAVPASLLLGSLLADEYQQLGRVDDLIELYEELFISLPGSWQIANNLALLLVEQRYQDPASLQRAVQLGNDLADTDDPAVMDTVGWVYYRGGDSERAIHYLERAAAALTDIPVVSYHLGMAYLATGNRVGAKQALEKAIQSAGTDFVGIDEAREALATL